MLNSIFEFQTQNNMAFRNLLLPFIKYVSDFVAGRLQFESAVYYLHIKSTIHLKKYLNQIIQLYTFNKILLALYPDKD